jgi:hypothetical protein
MPVLPDVGYNWHVNSISDVPMIRLVSLFSLVVVVALALSLAGCGGSSTAGTGGGQLNSSSKREAALAFARCVRSHGVPSFPDPGGGQSGGLQIAANQRSGSGQSMSINGVPISAPAFQAAMHACRKYLPRGRPLTPQQLANLRRVTLRMAICMRSHGVTNYPDPSIQAASNGAVRIRIGSPGEGPNPQSPAFQAAQRVCGSLLKTLGGP